MPSSPSKPSSSTFHATILPGNNHEMLVEALERRPWWRRNEEPTTDSDFWWGGNGQPFDWTNGTAKLINKMSVHSEKLVVDITKS